MITFYTQNSKYELDKENMTLTRYSEKPIIGDSDFHFDLEDYVTPRKGEKFVAFTTSGGMFTTTKVEEVEYDFHGR